MTSSENTAPEQALLETTAGHSRGLRVLGTVAALAALAWGAYWMTLLRTMGYGWYPDLVDLGPSLAGLGFVLTLFVLPVVLVLGYRRKLRHWLRMVVVICVASLFFAEAWARLEEGLWRRQAPELVADSTDPGLRWADPGPFPIVPDVSHETIFVHRWWPYDTHTLYYDPQTGLFGGYD